MEKSQMLLIFFSVLTCQWVLSFICSTFLLVQFISVNEIRRRKNNQILLAILIITFIQTTIELPTTLIYLRTGRAAHASNAYCLFWILCTFYLDVTGVFLMAYASIERYLFIFHNGWIDRHRLILRYIPISLCFLYPLGYYLGVMFLMPCNQRFIYSAFICTGGCFLYIPFWNAMTWVGNVTFPVCLILVVNILLMGRTLHQRAKMRRSQVWLKNRKMVVQLVSVASVYCLAWFPSVILILIVTFPPPNTNTALMFNIFQNVLFLNCFVPLLYPFVCLAGQPLILNKIKRLFQRHRIGIPSASHSTARTNKLVSHMTQTNHFN